MPTPFRPRTARLPCSGSSADHDDDAAREAEHHVHVVLDEEHRQVAREAFHGGEQGGALVLGHARCRLVEQQHARARGERERDLEQPLLAVGELAGQPVRGFFQVQRMQNCLRLVDGAAVRGERFPPGFRAAFAFEHRKRDGLERSEPRKQRVDLEGARQAALHAGVGPERGDVLLAEHDLAGVRPQHAGDQVDERRLPGAVGADERVAHALRQDEVDVLRHDEGAEFLVQLFRCKNFARPPRIPLGRNITTPTSSSPIQKYQYCGFMPENWSRATM